MQLEENTASSCEIEPCHRVHINTNYATIYSGFFIVKNITSIGKTMNLPERITLIKNHLETISNSKVQLAFELLYTKRSEKWSSTTWMSWKNFCNMNVALSTASVYVYTKTAELAQRNKFSEVQSDMIVGVVGWERFRLGLSKIDATEIITSAIFIERYKDLNLNERITHEEGESELVNFSFNVPVDTADILNGILTTHGMRTTNKSRSEMSSAMIKLVAYMEQEF